VVNEGKNYRSTSTLTTHSTFQRDLLIFAEFTETSKLLQGGGSSRQTQMGDFPLDQSRKLTTPIILEGHGQATSDQFSLSDDNNNTMADPIDSAL
jgi:hypothetical protein